MSLHLMLGQSKAGKSSRLYQMLIEESLRQPDARLLLLVPRQYTLQAQKKLLAVHPRSALMNVDILSFERLAYRIFDETGTSALQILDETGKSMIIRSLLLSHRDQLYAFRGSIGRRGFVEQMSSMISELIQYDISPQALLLSLQGAAGTRLHAKLRDIQLIYQAFMDFIRDRYLTAEGVLSLLCDVLEKSQSIRQSVIYMDNFADFTPLQYRLIEQLLRLCPQIHMTLCSDGPAPESGPLPEDIFCLTKETAGRLVSICKNTGTAVRQEILTEEEGSEDKSDLGFLRKELFRMEGRSLKRSGQPSGLSLYCALNPDEEMHLAARLVHHFARDKGLAYRQMAVVTGDMQTYLAPARRWLARYGIPCFFDARRPAAGNMLIEWLLSLLEALRRDMDYEHMFRFLRSGLGPLSRDETDQLENFVLACGIRGRRRWMAPFRTEKTAGGPEKLAALEESRQKVAALFERFRDLTGTGPVPVGDLVQRIWACMEDQEIFEKVQACADAFEKDKDLERALEYDQIYDVVIDLLEKTYRILGQEKMSIRDFSQVLESGVMQIRLGIIPPGLDQLTIGDMRRSRLDDVKVLIFAGLNEGQVPRIQQPAGLISDAEREMLAAASLKLAPTARESIPSERFYLYSALAKPSLELCLIYAATDSSGASLIPARIIRDIRGLFPDLQLKRPGEGLDLDMREGYEMVKAGLAGIRGDMWAGQADPAGEGTSFLPLYQWFCGRDASRDRMQQLGRAALEHYAGDRLSQAAVQAVYGGRLSGGVTMLEKYASCAYAHFLAYGMKLSARQVYTVQAPDIGLIFHKSIELFSRRVQQEGIRWKDIPDELRDQWIGQAVDEVAAGYRDQLMQDTGRARFLTEKIRAMAVRTVWALQQQLKKGDFEPEGYEMHFTTAIGPGSSDGPEEGPCSLFLNGVIDRIDTCQEDGQVYLRILDYKTGKMKFDLSSVYYGLSLQLMVYMQAARESMKDSGLLVIPAGVLYYDIDDPLVDVGDFRAFARKADQGEVGYSEEELMLLEKLAMNGLIVQDEEILRHMDRDPQNRPKILPVRINRDGTPDARSSVALPDQFFLLSEHVKHTCVRLAGRISAGEIGADPYLLGDRNACSWCDYPSVCGFSSSIPGCVWRRLRTRNRDEIYSAMAQEVGHADQLE